MKWTRELHGRWMQYCYLCGGYAKEERCSPHERRYACVNGDCGASFRFSLWRPSPRRQKGAFACLIIAPLESLRVAMRGTLYDEFVASCPSCGGAFVEKSDKSFYCCAKGGCGISVEFHLEKFPMSFVALVIIMRVPEPAFSSILEQYEMPQGRHN